MMGNELEIELQLKDRATEKLVNSGKKINATVTKMKANFVNLAAKVFLVQQAYRALTNVIGGLVKASIRQEDATLRLNNALKLQGEFTQDVAFRYQEFAKEIQRSTRFGNEAIQELMQQLISVGNVVPAQMERATKAAVNFAAATGRDLQTAALTVGKAMTGFTGELSRYGIIIDKNIPATEKATAALEAMERQFGGFAELDIQGMAGNMAQLANSWSDFLEELGAFITQSPLGAEMIEIFTEAFDFFSTKMEESRNKAEELNQGLNSLFGATGPLAEENLGRIVVSGKKVTKSLTEVKEAVGKVALELTEKFSNALGAAVAQGQSFKQAMSTVFRQFAANAIAEITKVIIKITLLRQSMKAATGGFGGFIGSIFGFAQGGIVGAGGTKSPLPMAAQGAMIGGSVGRAVPVIAHEGEVIGTPDKLAQSGLLGSGITVNVNNPQISGTDDIVLLAETLGFETENAIRTARGI